MKAQRGPTPAFWATVLLLVAGVAPLPSGMARAWRKSARSPQPSRVERDARAASYYEGLINVGDGSRSELALRLLGKPSGWLDFHQVDATRYLGDDLLQFELLPGIHREVLGKPFRTNRLGMRDREYAARKPAGVVRVALLGASMDMGWGVGDGETYENRVEDWLNAYSERMGLGRRFEVLNYSMAAYSPLHRLETFRRKAAGHGPDLVLYAGTLLDPRLLELHLCGLLQARIAASGYPFLGRMLGEAGVGPGDVEVDSAGSLRDKAGLKAKLRPMLWPMIGAIIGRLAEECRSRDVPLACVIVPRAGDSDQPGERGPDVARYAAIARDQGAALIDLSATFDGEDPAEVEIAAWDDHPNARGHKLLFQALAAALAEDPGLRRVMFGDAEPAGEAR